MEPSTHLKKAINEILVEIQTMFGDRSSGETEMKELVKKIKDEIEKSDVKASVILKQRLGKVLTDMEDLDGESSSNFASRMRCIPVGSSKSRLNDAEKKQVLEDLERVAHKAKYLNGERKELVGESEEDLELVGREKEKEDIVDQLVLLRRSGDERSHVPVITIAGLKGIGKTKLSRHVCEVEKVRKHVGLPAWVIGTKHNSTFEADSIAKQVIRSVVPVAATVPSQKILNILVILDGWRVEIEDKDVKALQEKVKEHWRVEIESIDVNALQEKVKEIWRVEIEGIHVKALQEKLKEDGIVENEILDVKVLQEKVKELWGVEIEDKDVKALQEKLKKKGRVEIGNEEALLKKVKEHRRAQIEGVDLKVLPKKLKEAHPRVRAIMITTRSCLVVRKIGASPVKSYVLAGLNEKESVSLLEKTLGRGAGDNVSVTKIVGQCRGVPLAIIAMAKWLHSPRSQELTPEEQLMCSYYDEGFPHLCFAYFSLFPQDFLFDAERLIHLWMAEGFLGSEPEKTGRRYLRDLVGKSMFQDVKVDEFGEVRSFKLHPLMHGKARLVADRENITMDPVGHKVHRKVERVSFDLSLDFLRGIPPSLFDKAKQLTSILFFTNTQSRLPMQLDMCTLVLENIFKSFKSLSVLDLRDLGIVAVPSSIGDLKELVYLDLSQNNMEKLPNSIAKLSKLQTLKLSRCYSLKELPKDFENLPQLKHLDMEGCLGITFLPPEKTKLTSLQTLSAFVNIKIDHIVGLDDLANINKLRGQLQIRVTKSLEEKDQHLQHLKLTWDLDPNLVVEAEKGKRPQAPLDRLKSHSALGLLILVGNINVGPSLSTWLTSGSNIQFKCLVKLSLQDCPGCTYLSEQDQLPQLKILELLRLDNLVYIAQKCNKEAVFYKTLEELTISDCPKLKSWWQGEIKVNERPVFGSISTLHVHHCPNLTCMPLYPRLEGSTSSSFGKELVLEGSSLKLLLDTRSVSVNYPIPLENLHIQNCNHLENLCDAFQHLSSLQRLTIENCGKINLDGENNQWEGLKSLRCLTIREIPIESLSFGDNVITLRELTVHNCEGLTSISDSIGKLTSLRRLEISKCNKLKSLPKEMKKLQSLKTLIILDCTLLLPRCQRETGDDWPQISHITHIQVK
ncbi:putative disease resistance protein RGA1 [Cajanus cajan]|uniref:putative disease resistance protein RGA1 n=1 Tax=Cajanus cajan TaxID=3821 RepID=UPI00098D8F21|nr:putative disease resistance protein RGA1 [Cajanus cajan]